MSFKKGELKKLLIEIGGEISGDMLAKDLVQAIREQLAKKEAPDSVGEEETDLGQYARSTSQWTFPKPIIPSTGSEFRNSLPTVRELTSHGPGTHFPRSV
jgi:hypothetical protein